MMIEDLDVHTARSELRAWRTVALVFAAMLIAGSTGAAWIMIRDGQRIGELEQKLRCYQSGGASTTPGGLP